MATIFTHQVALFVLIAFQLPSLKTSRHRAAPAFTLALRISTGKLMDFAISLPSLDGQEFDPLFDVAHLTLITIGPSQSQP